MIFTPLEVKTYYEARLPDFKIVGHEWRIECPIHNGDGLNFGINPNTGLAQCHSQCGRGWDMISLEQDLFSLDFTHAKERVFDLVGRPRVSWEERDVEAIYDYTDADGKLLYQVLRKTGKKFVQRRPDSDSWKWGLEGVPRVPFRLPQVSQADFVAIVEGEKDALSLERVGLTASCNSGGAGNFKPELVKCFTGKHIAIFPDNDDPGREHALKVARLLITTAKSLKIVELPGLSEKGDVSDFIQNGGTVEQLRECYRKSQSWTPEWHFSSDVPNENTKYVHSFRQEVDLSGGLTEFWELSQLTGIETPWRKLSRIFGGGLRNGEVYVLGGNQGSGKTSLALQFILASIRRSEGCLLFSMEMLWKAVFQRMASMEAEVDLNALRDAQFTMKRADATIDERETARLFIGRSLPDLARQTAELVELPLLVSTKTSVTPEYLISESTRIRKSQPLKLVVVDHMQLMGADEGTQGEYEKFTKISRATKHVATELNLPIILVSQTSRNQSKEHRKEPEVWDLRGSGALEEDAAGVALLYEDFDDRDLAIKSGDGSRYTKGPVKCFLKIPKNRYGEQGRVFELYHCKTYTRFKTREEL